VRVHRFLRNAMLASEDLVAGRWLLVEGGNARQGPSSEV
jgi:hypothetical protein